VDSVEAGGTNRLSSITVKRNESDINWVAVAVEMAGGVQAVARKIGVSRWTVYKWIDRGSMRRIAYETVVRLQGLSGVPIEKLTQE
jgi:DNA-binding phage protein